MNTETALIRLLRADEIECRISMISEKGLSLLLFKDARVDQKILDETFTPMGWKRTHQEIGGNLYCTVEIWDEGKQQWIAKQDVGTESYSEKEKGQASDSFKRACFNWGIGRELYTAPFIWVSASSVEIRPRGDKYFCNERFSVSRIEYDKNRVICELVIENSRKQTVYTYKSRKYGTIGKTVSGGDENGARTSDDVLQKAGNRAVESNIENGRTETAGNEIKANGGETRKKGGSPRKDNGLSLAQMADLERELKRTGVSLQMVLDRYLLSSIDEMTEANYEGAMRGLRNTCSKNKKAA